MKVKTIFASILAGISFLIPAGTDACTSVIISGKATPDGRPLMWKNTDTQNLNHRLIYSDNQGYPLIGIVRSDATNEDKASIWMGTNSEGFSIMNTLSYNLTENRVAVRNGWLMRRALEVCKDVDDFKIFLDTLKRPMQVEANYGVIDAKGNAAYFETYSDGYYMMDVNDPSIAPNGYLVYTNFSYNGFYDRGQGYIRYQTAAGIFAKGAPAKEFSPQWIFNNLSRSYYHSLMDIDFKSETALKLFANGYIPDSDFIPRKSTANTCIVQGVAKEENPDLTTFWAVLGYPPCSIAIPAWVKAGNDNSKLLMKFDDTYTSRICNMALTLKEEVFPVLRGNGEKYLNIKKVYNEEGSGYMQQIAPLEEYVFKTVNNTLYKWRESGKSDKAEMKRLIEEISSFITQTFPNP